MDFNSPTKEEIRNLMEKHKLTQAQFGEVVGTSFRTVCQWVLGNRAMMPTTWMIALMRLGEPVTIEPYEPAVRVRKTRKVKGSFVNAELYDAAQVVVPEIVPPAPIARVPLPQPVAGKTGGILWA